LPGIWTADAALMRNFHFTEQKYFQIRLEGYNIFNHPGWGCLNTNYTDPGFGQLQCRFGNRKSQIGLKFYF
jgi:hypothetical protein